MPEAPRGGSQQPERRHGRPLIVTSLVNGATASPTQEHGPRLDYIELARVMDATVLHAGLLPGPLGALERRTRAFGDWRQAWHARRSSASAFLSMTEKAALGIVSLDRRRPHVAIGQHLTTPRRRELQRRTGWLGRLDRLVVLCESQVDYATGEGGVPAERVRLVHRGIDQRFFAPQGAGAEGYVVSAGQHRRDYPTLIAAAPDVSAPVIIAASSPWVSERAELEPDVPANVTIRRGLARPVLRDLYDRASVVVVPLEPGLDIAAGVNAVLEGMSMRKPVVVTATPGIADYVRDGEDALVVPPRDPLALAAAIERILGDQALAERLAGAGRAVIDAGRNLDGYVVALRDVVAELVPLDEEGAAT